MSRRFLRFGTARDTAGNGLANASISIYKAGTTDAVKVYDAQSGGSSYTSTPQITADAYGKFEFWLDDGDYTPEQLFKIVVTSGTNSTTYDNVRIIYVVTQSTFAELGTDALEFRIGQGLDSSNVMEYQITSGENPPALVWDGVNSKWVTRLHDTTSGEMLFNPMRLENYGIDPTTGENYISGYNKSGEFQIRKQSNGSVISVTNGDYLNITTDFVSLVEGSSDKSTGISEVKLYNKNGDLHFRKKEDGSIIRITSGESVLGPEYTTLNEQGSDPTPASGEYIVYSKHDGSQPEMFGIGGESGSPQQISKGGILTVAVPAAIHLTGWQSDPNQYPVEVQDAYNTDGHGKDLLLHFVFLKSTISMIYTQVMIPFAGYDLRLCFPYRMNTAASGGTYWSLGYIAVSDDEALAEVTSSAGFGTLADAFASYVSTASSSANIYKMVDTDSFIIPSSAYSAGDMLVLKFTRFSTSGNDTHTGNAEVPKNGIYLKPVLPSA